MNSRMHIKCCIIVLLFRPERVCVSVCMSVREHISGTRLHVQSPPIFVAPTCYPWVMTDCGLVLLWQHCGTLCTSGLWMTSCIHKMTTNRPRKRRILKVTQQGAARVLRRGTHINGVLFILWPWTLTCDLSYHPNKHTHRWGIADLPRDRRETNFEAIILGIPARLVPVRAVDMLGLIRKGHAASSDASARCRSRGDLLWGLLGGDVRESSRNRTSNVRRVETGLIRQAAWTASTGWIVAVREWNHRHRQTQREYSQRTVQANRTKRVLPVFRIWWSPVIWDLGRLW